MQREMAAGSPIQTASSPSRENEKEQKCSRMTQLPGFANLSVSTALSWTRISRSQLLPPTLSLALPKHTNELRKDTCLARLYFASARLPEVSVKLSAALSANSNSVDPSVSNKLLQHVTGLWQAELPAWSLSRGSSALKACRSAR